MPQGANSLPLDGVGVCSSSKFIGQLFGVLIFSSIKLSSLSIINRDGA